MEKFDILQTARIYSNATGVQYQSSDWRGYCDSYKADIEEKKYC